MRTLLTPVPALLGPQIVADNIAYAKSVKFTGTRDNAAGLDFSGILEEVRMREGAVHRVRAGQGRAGRHPRAGLYFSGILEGVSMREGAVRRVRAGQGWARQGGIAVPAWTSATSWRV